MTLLRRADEQPSLTRRVAACFTDHRRPELLVHDVETLVLQRLHGLALAHEDLNDHEDLRWDLALPAVAGRTTPRRGDCAPLAGRSTLNRLELAAAGRCDRRAHKIVVDTRLREAWPSTRIIRRTDSGFCREPILAACERREGVDYVVGLAKNCRLEPEIAIEMAEAVREAHAKRTAARRFREFQYSTRTSWSRQRRVIGKAEALPPAAGGGAPNGLHLRATRPPRHVLTLSRSGPLPTRLGAPGRHLTPRTRGRHRSPPASGVRNYADAQTSSVRARSARRIPETGPIRACRRRPTRTRTEARWLNYTRSGDSMRSEG